MKTIAIVHNNILPLPAVKGGGIETLIDSLVEENEIEKRVKFLIVSPYDELAKNKSKKYTYTKYVYVKIPYLYHIAFRLIMNRILHRMFGWNYIIDLAHFLCAYKKLRKEKIDALIFDSKACSGYKKFKKIAPKNMIYYSHVFESPDTPEIMYDRVITISEFCKKPWLKWLDDDKISILRNGIDLSLFDKELTLSKRNVMRETYLVNDNDFLIVYCGRIVEGKGIKELIEAVLKIDDDHVKLMIVGDFKKSVGINTTYVKTIESLVEKSNGRIFFTGYVENNELYKYYKISDLQVVPSLCEEAAGLVAIEGMSCGLPLVVTNSGGMPEYVGDKAAVIIPKDNELTDNLSKIILELKNNPKRRQEMSKAGLERVRIFSRKEYYKRFIDIMMNY